MIATQHSLPNGLRLLTVPLHDTKAITVFVFIKVGSRYETRAINGISHFIEHLMFKGTKTRPSSLALTKLLDGVGAVYNAFTSKDCTAYYVKANAEHTELAFDVLSDMLQNSLYEPKEIERERGVIVEEINMYEDNPQMSIEDLFEEALFGKRHPLGWNIAGPRQVIRGVSRDAILRYRDKFYHPGNMWVVAAGRLPANTLAMTKRFFGRSKNRPRTPSFRTYQNDPGAPTIRLRHRPMEQVQVALGVRALKYQDPRLPILSVLANILGGTMSSRLFIEVREKRGLAYSVSASVNPYEDTGALMVHAGLDKSKLTDALRVIVGELRRLKETRVGTAELRRAKEYLRGRMILDLEDSDALAGWYGRQALFARRIETPDQMLKKIAAVSVKDVQTLALKLLRRSQLRLAVIGPFRSDREWRPILREL